MKRYSIKEKRSCKSRNRMQHKRKKEKKDKIKVPYKVGSGIYISDAR